METALRVQHHLSSQSLLIQFERDPLCWDVHFGVRTRLFLSFGVSTRHFLRFGVRTRCFLMFGVRTKSFLRFGIRTKSFLKLWD